MALLRLSAVALGLSVLGACGHEQSVATVTVPAPTLQLPVAPVAADPQLAQSLVGRIVAAERAYEERGEPQAILAFIADDARIEAGRSQRPSVHDWSFTHKRLEAIYTWAAQYASGTTFSYEDVNVIESDPTHLVFVWKTMSESSDHQESWFGERYELALRGGEWKAVAFRYWPLRPDTKGEWGAAYFAGLDKKIDEALAQKDEREAAYNMMLAYRFDECARIARPLADANPDDWWVWDMRSRASAMVGDLEDALRAKDKAAQLKK